MELWDIGPRTNTIFPDIGNLKRNYKNNSTYNSFKRIKHIAISLTKKENGRDGQNR